MAKNPYEPPKNDDRPPAVPTEGGVRVVGGIEELTYDLRSPYINHDLAPTKVAERRWGTKDIAALWISMSACVSGFRLKFARFSNAKDQPP